jgi:starch synthase
MARILMVASEATPFSKTGGLADVLGSLPPALVRLGEEVGVVVPRYRHLAIPPEDRIWDHLLFQVGAHEYSAAIDQVIRRGVRYFFVDCPPLYERGGIYGEHGGDYADNHIRFAALCQAALGIARHIFPTDVFHAHDWQAGLLPVYLRENLSGDPTFFHTRRVFTIHNLGYQGNFPSGALGELGLHPWLFHPEALEFYGRISLLKGGIVWSDAVTTVSPNYAREIQTPGGGFGMDGLLRSRASKLSGILNGIDYNEWNPASDPYLPAHYSAGDLSGKRACKLALLEEMGLPPDPDRPLVGLVSRFAYQKGTELVPQIAAALMQENLALVVLGSGEWWMEDQFRKMAEAYPDRVAVRVGYDEGLSHRVEAGTDIFLMPSRYEPCGLNQIYSLRYGTVPVVRATGGLEDTVDQETGFKFLDYSAPALMAAVRDALGAFWQRDSWTERMRRGMAKDFSWDASAARYRDLYRSM